MSVDQRLLSLAPHFAVFTPVFPRAKITSYDPQDVLNLYTTNQTVTQRIFSRAQSSLPYSDHHFHVIRPVHSLSYSCSSYDKSFLQRAYSEEEIPGVTTRQLHRLQTSSAEDLYRTQLETVSSHPLELRHRKAYRRGIREPVDGKFHPGEG